VRHFLRLRLLQTLDLNDRRAGRFLEHVLAVEALHFLVLAHLVRRHVFLLARHDLLVARVLGDAEHVQIGLGAFGHRVRIQLQ
jgi:hypothetical protein